MTRDLKRTLGIVRQVLSLFLVLLLQIIFSSSSIDIGKASCMIYPVIMSNFSIGKNYLMGNLIKSFSIGHAVDFIYNKIGYHSTASMIYVILQHYLIKILYPKVIFSKGFHMRNAKIGILDYLLVGYIPLLVHLIVYFNLESMDATLFITNLQKGVLSSIYSYIVILIIERFLY